MSLRPRVVRPTPRRGGWPIRIVRWLWTLPTNLVGHAAGWVLSGGPPQRVGGAAAVGWIYPIRSGLGLDWVGAVTLGHAILYRPGMFDGVHGRWVLAHELAHTRQHDLLGPLYLPLHVEPQTLSAALSLAIPGRVSSRVHAYNPLEQTFICLGASACRRLANDPDAAPGGGTSYLSEFGV